MVIQPLVGNPYNGYINPYYWVDDHPLLYGNNGGLDPGTYASMFSSSCVKGCEVACAKRSTSSSRRLDGEKNMLHITSLKLTVRPWKWMVGILVSFWDGLFSGQAVSFRECNHLNMATPWKINISNLIIFHPPSWLWVQNFHFQGCTAKVKESPNFKSSFCWSVCLDHSTGTEQINQSFLLHPFLSTGNSVSDIIRSISLFHCVIPWMIWSCFPFVASYWGDGLENSQMGTPRGQSPDSKGTC